MDVCDNDFFNLIILFCLRSSSSSSKENLRRLSLGIIVLEEKLEELKMYAQELVRDKSKFDPDVSMNISRRLVSAAYELSQSYENYKAVGPTP